MMSMGSVDLAHHSLPVGECAIVSEFPPVLARFLVSLASFDVGSLGIRRCRGNGSLIQVLTRAERSRVLFSPSGSLAR